MLNFSEDYINLTKEQLRDKDFALRNELVAINKRATQHPKSLTTDITRRIADISDWLDSGNATDPANKPVVDGGFLGVPSMTSRDAEEQKAKIFGEYLQAAAAAGSEPGRSYGRFQTGVIDRSVLYPIETRSSGAEESTPSLGGFLIGKMFSTEIIQKVYETGGLYSRCRKIPIGPNFNGLKLPFIDETSRATGSRLGGVQGYWLEEGGTKTASKPKFGQIELSLKKLIGLNIQGLHASNGMVQSSLIRGNLKAAA